MSETYEDRAAFLFVAIRNPGHPSRETLSVIGESFFEDETTEDRLRLNRRGVEAYNFRFPGLYDEDGTVEYAYGAYPKRLLIVGIDGRITYDGGRGVSHSYRPTGWDLEEVDRQIRLALSESNP